MRQSENTAKVWSALVKVQADLVDPEKKHTAKVKMKGGGEYSYQYAKLGDALPGIRKLCAKNELALSQYPEGGDTLWTRFTHTSSEFVEFPFPYQVPRDPQAQGSVDSYMRRYALFGVLGVAAGGDDDGQNPNMGAKEKPAPKPEPWANVAGLWADTFDPLTVDGHIWPFLRFKKKDHPADMKAEQRTKALGWLQNGGSSQLEAFLEQIQKDHRGAFYGALGAVRTKPTKQEYGDGWEEAKAAHKAWEVAVKRHMYGVDSLNDVTPAQALGARGIGWIRESGEFETVVGEVES